MSFVATANPPAKDVEGIVANSPFWPAVDLQRLRADLRLDGTVTPERLRLAVVAAMWAINNELTVWRALMQQRGITTLQDVPAEHVGGASVKLAQYQRAVYSHVQSQLAEAYRDMDTLPQGANKEARVTSALELRVDGFNQQLRWALADLQDQPRTIAALL